MSLSNQIISVPEIARNALLNGTGDAIGFVWIFENLINPILRETHALDYRPEDLPDALREQALEAIGAAIKGYRADGPAEMAAWGWKNRQSVAQISSSGWRSSTL